MLYSYITNVLKKFGKYFIFWLSYKIMGELIKFLVNTMLMKKK